MAKKIKYNPRSSRMPQIVLDLKYLDGVAEYLKAHQRKTKRVLFKLGGYVRNTMRNSMKPKRVGGKPSTPPKPPKYMKKNEPNLRSGIGFTVEYREKRVVIGPDRFDKRSKSGRGAKPRRAGQTVPQVLNEGGEVLRWNMDLPGVVFETVRIKPRPFVAPAHKAGGQKFLELLRTEKLRIKGRR